MCKCFISEMDVIADELRENGIDVGKATLSYFINKTYHTYYNVYSSVLGKLSYEDLFTVWEKTRPETFGHVMAFLTTVHFQTLTDEQIRDVVRITVPILRNVDLAEYRREGSTLWISTPLYGMRCTVTFVWVRPPCYVVLCYYGEWCLTGSAL